MAKPSPRGVTIWLLKLAVMAGVLWFVLHRIAWDDHVVVRPGPPAVTELQPGVRTLLANLDQGLFGWALLLAGPPVFLMTVRWRILLRAAEVAVPFREIVRLTYLGNFFNLFVPGGTGGDVIKGFGVARTTSRKAEAVATILADRACGLVGLTVMAAVAVLFRFAQLGSLARWIGTFLVLLATGILLYLSPWVRRVARIDRLMALLPAPLRRFDEAMVATLRRPRALLTATALTIVMQATVITAISFGGRALGIRASLPDYLVLVPIGYLVNTLPLSPGGFGLMEAAFQQLFAEAGLATPTQGFLLGLLVRSIGLVWSLPGLVAWLVPASPAPAD
jgi:uncharacterized protein (TIRG00374 family)